jgi:voltage-gated potassium channel Kch
MDQPALPQGVGSVRYAVVAGFGLPGRTLVDFLVTRGIDYVVIELNPQTCQRTAVGGIRIIPGSASDPEILRKAEVHRADLVALMVPNDEVVLSAVTQVRQMNPTAHIIARCSFTSTGMEAVKRGANQSLVAEQVIARELVEITSGILG